MHSSAGVRAIAAGADACAGVGTTAAGHTVKGAVNDGQVFIGTVSTAADAGTTVCAFTCACTAGDVEYAVPDGNVFSIAACAGANTCTAAGCTVAALCSDVAFVNENVAHIFTGCAADARCTCTAGNFQITGALHIVVADSQSAGAFLFNTGMAAAALNDISAGRNIGSVRIVDLNGHIAGAFYGHAGLIFAGGIDVHIVQCDLGRGITFIIDFAVDTVVNLGIALIVDDGNGVGGALRLISIGNDYFIIRILSEFAVTLFYVIVAIISVFDGNTALIHIIGAIDRDAIGIGKGWCGTGRDDGKKCCGRKNPQRQFFAAHFQLPPLLFSSWAPAIQHPKGRTRFCPSSF